MQLHREWVLLEGKHHTALVVRPVSAALPLPAVIVVQEAWGIDDHILDVVARVAAAGYVAVAPDLYWQDGGRPAPLVAGRVAVAKRFMDSLPPGAGATQPGATPRWPTCPSRSVRRSPTRCRRFSQGRAISSRS